MVRGSAAAGGRGDTRTFLVCAPTLTTAPTATPVPTHGANCRICLHHPSNQQDDVCFRGPYWRRTGQVRLVWCGLGPRCWAPGAGPPTSLRGSCPCQGIFKWPFDEGRLIRFVIHSRRASRSTSTLQFDQISYLLKAMAALVFCIVMLLFCSHWSVRHCQRIWQHAYGL